MKGFKMFFLAMVMLVGLLASIDVEAGSVVISADQHLVTLSVGPGGNIDCLMPKQEAYIIYDDEGNPKIVVRTIPGYFPVEPSDILYIIAFSYKTGYSSDKNRFLMNTTSWSCEKVIAKFDSVSLTANILGTANNDRTWWYVVLNDQTVRRINPKKLFFSYGETMKNIDPTTIKLLPGGCVQYGKRYALPKVIFDGTTETIRVNFNMNTIGSTMVSYVKSTDIAKICWKSFDTDEKTCAEKGLQTDNNGNLYVNIRSSGNLMTEDRGNILLYKSDGYSLSFLYTKKWQLSKNAWPEPDCINLFHYNFALPMK